MNFLQTVLLAAGVAVRFLTIRNYLLNAALRVRPGAP
jgi:hypothetical protein